jgi:hypothetical protein
MPTRRIVLGLPTLCWRKLAGADQFYHEILRDPFKVVLTGMQARSKIL